MNLVDILIILFSISAFIRGAELGLIRQFFSTSGFLGGLFVGAWLEPKLIHFAHTPLSRTALALGVTLGAAFIAMGIGEYVGVFLKTKVQKHRINIVDASFGSVIGIITLLLGVWLATTILVKLPFPSLQDDIRGSLIVRDLTKTLPSAPNVIAGLGHLVDPNGFPQVFSGNEPIPTPAQLPDIGALQPAVKKDLASVVKIAGGGCGGIVEGSGFVVAPGLVATNAHVIAGVAQPFVSDQTGRYAAQAVWFDPNLDFAVLRVPNLSDAPLALDATVAARGTAAAVLGYPGGGGFSAHSAVVLDEFNAVGRNIYNQGVTNRDIYEIKAHVIPGNSGGPLIESNGAVIGIVFAESTSYNNVGYALTLPKVINEIQQAESQGNVVSTGTCAE